MILASHGPVSYPPCRPFSWAAPAGAAQRYNQFPRAVSDKPFHTAEPRSLAVLPWGRADGAASLAVTGDAEAAAS